MHGHNTGLGRISSWVCRVVSPSGPKFPSATAAFMRVLYDWFSNSDMNVKLDELLRERAKDCLFRRVAFT